MKPRAKPGTGERPRELGLDRRLVIRELAISHWLRARSLATVKVEPAINARAT